MENGPKVTLPDAIGRVRQLMDTEFAKSQLPESRPIILHVCDAAARAEHRNVERFFCEAHEPLSPGPCPACECVAVDDARARESGDLLHSAREQSRLIEHLQVAVLETEARAVQLQQALQRAVQTIRTWHGMGMGAAEAQAWALYQASPEMQQITAALAGPPAKAEAEQLQQTLRELLEAIQGEAAAYCEEHDGCDRIRRLTSLALEKVAALAGTPAPPASQPRYCTCTANGIELPSAHAKDCRMAAPPASPRRVKGDDERWHEAGCPYVADDESDQVLADYGECVCEPTAPSAPQQKQQCPRCQEWCAHGFCGRCERVLAAPPTSPCRASETGAWCSDYLGAAPPPAEAQTPPPEHVCGLRGYNGMIDPPCPACEASRLRWAAKTPKGAEV